MGLILWDIMMKHPIFWATLKLQVLNVESGRTDIHRTQSGMLHHLMIDFLIMLGTAFNFGPTSPIASGRTYTASSIWASPKQPLHVFAILCYQNWKLLYKDNLLKPGKRGLIRYLMALLVLDSLPFHPSLIPFSDLTSHIWWTKMAMS